MGKVLEGLQKSFWKIKMSHRLNGGNGFLQFM